MSGDLQGRAVITGIGQSQTGRRLGRTGFDLTIEACKKAIADAGLSVEDIDGVASYPGPGLGATGMSGASTTQLHAALGIKAKWYLGASEVAGQLGPLMEACMAVSLGFANHVVCFRSVWESTAQGSGGFGGSFRGPYRASGFMEWTAPYGAISAANWIAMLCDAYMHRNGMTREQLAMIALNARRNAGLNPAGIYRDPLTLDDYMSARIISTPFCLYDCDIPADGAIAIIVSRRDASKGLPRTPIKVEAFGGGLYERFTWDQRADLTTMAAHDAAASMWENTKIKPTDVDVAELYDGFSYLTIQWIEALGFCPQGEVGKFIEGGQRISLEGQLPVNTHGGQLSAGRLHGYGFIHEACTQLWREGGERQAKNDVNIAVAAAGGGPIAGCVLLSI
jgi:acetyl-CoA acetyltransferase